MSGSVVLDSSDEDAFYTSVEVLLDSEPDEHSDVQAVEVIEIDLDNNAPAAPIRASGRTPTKSDKVGAESTILNHHDDIDNGSGSEIEVVSVKTTTTNKSPGGLRTTNPHEQFKMPSAKLEPDAVPLVLSSDPLVQVPASINQHLRDYQREGVQFLYGLYRDDMGLGKTIQSIAFICAVLDSGGREQTTNWSFFKKKTEPKAVLVVVPSSVITQWKREIQKWSKLRTDVFQGNDRAQTLDACKAGRLEVLLTGYDLFRTNASELDTVDWKMIIFDEIHKIKNKQSKLTIAAKSVTTTRRFGLTGTVMQNSFEELWTLVDFIRPGYLSSLPIFRESFINPIKHGQRHDATYSQIAKGRHRSRLLASKVNQIILRRDKSILADALPEKAERIVFCALSDVQLDVYRRTLQSPDFQTIMQLTKLCDCQSQKLYIQCCDVALVVAHQKKDSDPEKFQRDVDFQDIAFGEDKENILQLVAEGNHAQLCGKIKVLQQLLPVWRQRRHKVLLFSFSTKILDLLQQLLDSMQYGYCRLDGSVPTNKRQTIVDLFNRSPCDRKPVFLISTKAGGLGLNLVSANIVGSVFHFIYLSIDLFVCLFVCLFVLFCLFCLFCLFVLFVCLYDAFDTFATVVFDPNWNVTHDLQAQDRAYRIGQTKKTEVFRLITAGTIEEIVYNRQVYKQQMASVGLEGKSERRYFKGVQGQKGQQGELFGMANLLRLSTEDIMTDEIIKRTRKAEEDLKRELEKSISPVFDNQSNNNHSTNSINNNNNNNNNNNSSASEEQSDMNALFQQPLDDDLYETSALEKQFQSADDILQSAGVVYSHLNTEVVGESEIEKRISQRAAVTFVDTQHAFGAQMHVNPNQLAERRRMVVPKIASALPGLSGLSSSSPRPVRSFRVRRAGSMTVLRANIDRYSLEALRSVVASVHGIAIDRITSFRTVHGGILIPDSDSLKLLSSDTLIEFDDAGMPSTKRSSDVEPAGQSPSKLTKHF